MTHGQIRAPQIHPDQQPPDGLKLLDARRGTPHVRRWTSTGRYSCGMTGVYGRLLVRQQSYSVRQILPAELLELPLLFLAHVHPVVSILKPFHDEHS